MKTEGIIMAPVPTVIIPKINAILTISTFFPRFEKRMKIIVISDRGKHKKQPIAASITAHV